MRNTTGINRDAGVSRRQFLKWLGAAGAGVFLAGCHPKPLTPAPQPTAVPATAMPTATPNPTLTPVPTPTSTPASVPVFGFTVAIGQVPSYDPQQVRAQLEAMLDDLGGLGDLVSPGARVGIKVNLTGSTAWDGEGKPLATEYFVTHPAVVGALAELLRDAGAAEISIMDATFEEACFEKWGYAAMAKPLNARLVNLDKPDPYGGYARVQVGPNPLVYDWFYLNGLLRELDVFISVGKMKCHSTTGVTLSLKNLVGITPLAEYRQEESHTFRSALHGNIQFDTRMPRVIVDLNRARPVHLAVIDGIITAEGGAGPWDATLAQVHPGLLIVGKNPVATDAVTTSVMGFDPEAASGERPFTSGENHLALANAAGLGTHHLGEIRVAGPALNDVKFPFKPVGSKEGD